MISHAFPKFDAFKYEEKRREVVKNRVKILLILINVRAT